ncbi:hypothetical protein LTR94_034308, partial [Friedmanniomyces endolithicus]
RPRRPPTPTTSPKPTPIRTRRSATRNVPPTRPSCASRTRSRPRCAPRMDRTWAPRRRSTLPP